MDVETVSSWPAGAGEMAGRMRVHPWALTPLGTIDTWPERLKAAVELVLANPIVSSVAVGPDRRLIYNDAAARLYGAHHPAALGRPLAETFADSYPAVAALYDRVFAGEAVQVHAQPLDVGGAGGDEVFDASLTPVRAADGTVLGAYMVGFETGARTRMEVALRESEARFRAFTTASADVIYRMGPDWSEMRRLEGRAFLPDTESPSGDWLDRYIHPDDQPTVRAAIARAIRDRTTFELEHRVIRADGTLGWILSRAVPILTEGGGIGEWLGAASDVTEAKAAEVARAEAEAEARKAQARYLALFNVIDQGFCTIAVAFDAQDRPSDYRFLEVSPSFERQTGIANAAGRWMREIAPDQDQLWFDIYGHVARTGEPERFEAFSTPLDRWWEVFAFRVEEPAERCIGVLFRDISDRKRAEAALRASEERLRQFGEASQDVLWLRNVDTLQWEYLTPAFETIYGIDRAAALRGDNMTGWLELVVPEDREHAAASLERVRNGEWVTFEFRIRRPVDGGVRWLRDTDFPIRDASGKVVRFGGVGHDVTLLKETERALVEAEKRQSALINGMPQLVWRGVDGGRWTWASPQWAEFTGQAEADSHEFGWLEAVHPDDRKRVGDLWEGAIERGEFHAEYRIRHQLDGRYRWFQSRASPVRDEAGVIVEWLGTSTDVQDLRSLQDRQRVLLHELQHRVRNTLAVVRSIASSTGETSETVEDFASHLEGRLNALARTQMVLTRAPGDGVDLESMVREELLAQAAREGQIDIAGPDTRLSPKAAEVLTLAIHELATNAVKYGALTAAAGRVAVRWSTSERGAQSWLTLIWEESGVRVAATAPRREGFGTELIETRVPYELRGSGALHFQPGGVRCEIAFPLLPGESMLETHAPIDDAGKAER